MSRNLALPLFLLTFALCVIFASRTPQPIIEELSLIHISSAPRMSCRRAAAAAR